MLVITEVTYLRGADDADVPAIERRDLSDPETLGRCDGRGVHGPDADAFALRP